MPSLLRFVTAIKPKTLGQFYCCNKAKDFAPKIRTTITRRLRVDNEGSKFRYHALTVIISLHIENNKLFFETF